ncbi:MAG: cupredoxin domain-containing protein [Actinomycetota bacterium]
MTMMAWRFLYWLFFAVGVIGVVLGAAVLLRAMHHRRPKVLIVTATLLIVAGLSGIVIVVAAEPGGFGQNIMGMGGMSMMGGRSDVGPTPAASPGASKQTMRASEFAFLPAEFSVRAGETLNVELQNGGSILHTFTIHDLNFEVEANAGQKASGALRVERPGIYEFICSVPGHAQSGMRGRVIVN